MDKSQPDISRTLKCANETTGNDEPSKCSYPILYSSYRLHTPQRATKNPSYVQSTRIDLHATYTCMTTSEECEELPLSISFTINVDRSFIHLSRSAGSVSQLSPRVALAGGGEILPLTYPVTGVSVVKTIVSEDLNFVRAMSDILITLKLEGMTHIPFSSRSGRPSRISQDNLMRFLRWQVAIQKCFGVYVLLV